jgi:hypothetical protein
MSRHFPFGLLRIHRVLLAVDDAVFNPIPLRNCVRFAEKPLRVGFVFRKEQGAPPARYN